jgi:hypothetical protein
MQSVIHKLPSLIIMTLIAYQEHLHQRSVCDPALVTLDEVHQENPVNPLEDYKYPDSEKMYSFASPGGALEESNKHSQIAFIHCSLFPIGYIV